MVVGGEKKPVGVVVEIEQVEQDLSLGGVVQDVGVVREKDERKKVRVCRECLNVVLCVASLSSLESCADLGTSQAAARKGPPRANPNLDQALRSARPARKGD